jgi:hypothetical protein
MRRRTLILDKTSFDHMISDGSIRAVKDALLIDLTRVQLKLSTGGGSFVTFKQSHGKDTVTHWDLKEKFPDAARALESDATRKMSLGQFFTRERLEALGASKALVTRILDLFVTSRRDPALKGIFTVGDLVDRVSYMQLLRIDFVGKKTANIIQAALQQVGLSIRMQHFLGPPY